jgi:outer membrane biosynthesis protein TonB
MDVRDAVAEMAARAQEISIEAGSKMTGALRDVIHAAAGLSNFALESARDLTSFFVKRGQMTQEDADKLLREAEEAAGKKKPVAAKPAAAAPAAAPKAAPAKPVPLKASVAAKAAAPKPAPKPAAPPKKPAPAAKKPAPVKAKKK